MNPEPAALASALRDAFGWPDPFTVVPGQRGATAHVWDVRVGSARYALKVGRGDRPSEAAIATEVVFIDRARAAGIGVPSLHADTSGRRVVPGPDGTWLRLYDWAEAAPADLGSTATAEAIGALLGRLHQIATPVTTESDGGPPDPWYERPPALEALQAMSSADLWWAARLGARMTGLPELLAIATPADPARLVLCHRDLHPGNVLLDASGSLVVLDPDDLGPADPARELARALFDWWSDPGPDLGMMRTMHRAYVAAGGPARVRRPGDLSMLVATRLNFLLRQLRIATDPATEEAERAWADHEIDESLRILPSASQVHEVLAALDADGMGAAPGDATG